MITLSVPARTRSLSPGVSRSSPSSPMSRPHERDMRGRSGSLTLQRKAEISLCPQLSPSQVLALRKSWRHINTKGLISVLSRVFQRLESACPAASRCFTAQKLSNNKPGSVKTVGDHARYMLQFLDKIIEGEQDEDEVREMGARHASLHRAWGLSVTDLDRFQEIFVDVFLKLDGVKQSKETSRAWRMLICEMVNLFREGYDTQLRQFRRKHSFNAHTQYFERRSSLTARKASLNNDPRKMNLTDF